MPLSVKSGWVRLRKDKQLTATAVSPKNASCSSKTGNVGLNSIGCGQSLLDQNTSQCPAAAQGADCKKLEQQVGKQLQALVVSGAIRR